MWLAVGAWAYCVRVHDRVYAFVGLAGWGRGGGAGVLCAGPPRSAQDTAKYVGVVMLRDTRPSEPTKFVRLKKPGEEDPEPEPPADFEWDSAL